MSCKLCSLFLSNYDTGVLAYVPGFNSFLLLRDEQNSVCVCGGEGGLAVIKCIYLPPTYLHFMQDIEDRCLLLTSSMSFVDLPFQEHPMTETHDMNQSLSFKTLPKPKVHVCIYKNAFEVSYSSLC
jgi:hypothetical protein